MLLLAHSSWKTYTNYPNKKVSLRARQTYLIFRKRKYVLTVKGSANFSQWITLQRIPGCIPDVTMMPLAPSKLDRNLKIYQNILWFVSFFYKLNGTYKKHWIRIKKCGIILPFPQFCWHNLKWISNNLFVASYLIPQGVSECGILKWYRSWITFVFHLIESI